MYVGRISLMRFDNVMLGGILGKVVSRDHGGSGLRGGVGELV